MLIYPAIDIKDGKCVRLQQGQMDKATVYNEIPSQAAIKWESLGATHLHVVDLDGAFEGRLTNIKEVEDITKAVKIPLQLGGGIRDLETIEKLLGLGIARVILGTAALRDQSLLKQAVKKYASRIVVGIDARDGLVAVEGWQQTSSAKALEFAKQMEALGVETIIFTDIWRDGMLTGPNFTSIGQLIQNTRLEVIASGGVSQLEHLIRLKQIGASGAVVGKALYTGHIDLVEALSILKEED